MSGLQTLYGTRWGRAALKVLASPALSRLAGKVLSGGLSRAFIPGFIRRNNIDMSSYTTRKYRSFNDFFTRELAPGAREIDMNPNALVAPCDGRLSVYTITKGCEMTIKSQKYTVKSLLRDDSLARQFEGGLALVFRLCVDDYHRYCFFDSGTPGVYSKIPGRLHTVRPQALERVPVFAENSREYLLMKTDNFGAAVQVEVGAMMVGKIRNPTPPSRFLRGTGKGMFEFGGSTVVLLLQGGRAVLREDIAATIGQDCETNVRLGEKIGAKMIDKS